MERRPTFNEPELQFIKSLHSWYQATLLQIIQLRQWLSFSPLHQVLPCNNPHFIKDCEFLPDAKRDTQKKASRLTAIKLHRLTAVKLYQKSVYKGKGKRHRAFDAEVSDSNDDDFFSESEEEEKVGDEISALSKEAASKVLKSEWVADSGFFSHMTDQLQLFSGPLIWMRRRWIRVGGDIYTLTIVEWSLCESGQEILWDWVQHSMCLDLGSIFFRESECAKWNCMGALINTVFRCVISMARL